MPKTWPDWYALCIIYFAIFCFFYFQIHETGAARRGKLRDQARQSVRTYYDLFPEAPDRGHGQREYYDQVASRVDELLGDGGFHKGPRDENVIGLLLFDHTANSFTRTRQVILLTRLWRTLSSLFSTLDEIVSENYF